MSVYLEPVTRVMSKGRLRRLLAYAHKVFGLDAWLGRISDTRCDPSVPTKLVSTIVFLVGLLRIRSFNALEPRLAEESWQRLLGVPVREGQKVCSVDTLAYSLQRMDPSSVRAMGVGIVKKAERNKVFREGWHAALRYVAIDGWEPHSSRERCCSGCLTRTVTTGKGKNKTQVTEYYHRYVVALLLNDKLEVVLDFEPVRSEDIRKEAGEQGVDGHEGELTAAKRLVERLHDTYKRWIDVLVCDALYSNGPFFTLAKECGFGVIAVVKKQTDEPLKEALNLWHGQPPHNIFEDDKKHELIELHDARQIQTLSTYDGPIRVLKGVVHKTRETKKTKQAEAEKTQSKTSTWCFAVTGKAMRLPIHKTFQVGRARWHIENTGFCQWTRYWPFSHVFTHGAKALHALLWFFFIAFNLMQLFVYRQLGGYGRDNGGDVTRTFLRLIDEMRDELARLAETIIWDSS